MMPWAIRCHRVSKRFRLGASHDALVSVIASGIRRLSGRKSDAGCTALWAVRDVEFSAMRGEALGIIGPNGAGKSTILKLLAGILRPDEGEIAVPGRVTALIEVGAGFNGDLTGRENVFLNGAILGMSRTEVQRKLAAIVDFAGMGPFLDEPVKHYSSGMYARLGFSIAAHVDPDVLLVDEVLSVGDAAFRLRCMERMRYLLEQGTTLILVTHNLEQMQSICAKTLVMESGRCLFAGPSQTGVAQYLAAVSRSYAARPTDLPLNATGAEAIVTGPRLRILSEGGEEVVWSRGDQPLTVELKFQLWRPVARLIVELNLRSSPQDSILSFNSGRAGRVFRGEPGGHTVRLALPGLPLAGGQYFWNTRLWDAERGVTLLDTPLHYPMVIDDGGRATGRFVLEHDWQFDALETSLRPSTGAPSDWALQGALT